MHYRKIKNQKVSLLGMGCMRFPLKENSQEIDEVATEQMIDFAYQNGVNYFDTAYPYHNGMSEIVVGKILNKYARDSFLLADKLPIWKCNALEEVKTIFQEQLKKCQVTYFDFYLCHAMNLEYFQKYKDLKVFPYLLELRNKGIIKHLGFSFHDAAQNILPIVEELDWDFAQIQLNYLDYEMQDAKKQYEILTSKNISVVVMEPIRGGLLADICLEASTLFKAKQPTLSNAAWALRYVADFLNVKVVLSGMSHFQQLQENVNTYSSDVQLDEEERDIIQKAKKLILGNDFIPCTSCRYCMPCPLGVHIPEVFKIFNMYGIHKNVEKYNKDMERLDESAHPRNCIHCGKCLKQCPQRIDIPNRFVKILQK